MIRTIYICVGASLLSLSLLSGCENAESEVKAASTWQVAVDQKSKEVFKVDSAIQLPIANPQNTKSKLLPAWYCEACQAWYPIPPLEQMNRSKGAGVCPKGGQPLQPDGPEPSQSLSISTGEGI